MIADATPTPMARILARFPRLRRARATAIVHSGGFMTIFGCLCGAYHTASTDWHGRDAAHVVDWRSEHDACAAELASRLHVASLREKLIPHPGGMRIRMPVVDAPVVNQITGEIGDEGIYLY